jgi:hypothetical protein
MASEIKVDTISEKTSANGVTIDGVNIKDSALATAGSVPLTTIDIDGGTDIGAAIVDADLFIVDDGAGGTNRKVTASRIKTYAGTTINNATQSELVTIGSTTTELDAEANLTFTGSALTCIGTITVGVDNTGHDVKYFGATSGSYALWDESADDLNLIASGLGVTTAKDLGAGIHIRTADSGASALAGADELVIENNGVAGLSILTSTSTAGTIAFGDSGDNDIGKIAYDHSGNVMSITAAAAEKMNFGSTEVVVNDPGADLDFRVESDTYTHMFSVNAGNHTVGIGRDTDGPDLGVGLHIKSDDSGASVSGDADELVLENNTNTGLSIFSGTSNDGNIMFGDSGDADIGMLKYDHSDNHLRFYTNAGERMRIQSDGELSIGQTTATAYMLNVEHDNSSNYVAQFLGTHASVPDLMRWRYTASPDSDDHYFHYAQDGTAARWAVNNQGDVVNHDNSYGSISDERIKQDISDASSQWDDIKAMQVRKFRMKDDIRQYGEVDAEYRIGLIAQELEAISPKLIGEGKPSTGDIASHSDFGTLYTEQDKIDGNIPAEEEVGAVKEITQNIKRIKYSVLYMKAIKALQEAQTRIETLEAKVTALEG